MPPLSYNRKTIGKQRKSNAVFSKLVSVADHPAVRRGVAEDMKKILKKPPQNDSHRWNNAPRNDSTRSSDRFDPKRIRMPGRGLSFLRPKDQMVVRRVSREDDENESSPPPVIKNYDLFNNFNDIIAEAGLIPKQGTKNKKHKASSGKVRFNNAKKAFEFRESDEEDDEEKEGQKRIPKPINISNIVFNDVLKPQVPKQSQARTRTQFFEDPIISSTPIPGRHDFLVSDDEEEMPAVEELPEEERGFSLFESDFYMQKPNEFTKAKKMPTTLPKEEIITRTVGSLPKLTLRNGSSLNYTSLVTKTCRKSILNQQALDFKRIQGFNDEDDTLRSSTKFMDFWNVTVHQAARENTEILRNIDTTFPLDCSFSPESPCERDSPKLYGFEFLESGNNFDSF